MYVNIWISSLPGYGPSIVLEFRDLEERWVLEFMEYPWDIHHEWTIPRMICLGFVVDFLPSHLVFLAGENGGFKA